MEVRVVGFPRKEPVLSDISSASESTYPAPPPITEESRPDEHKVGMIAFLVSEFAFFSTLIMAYVIYLGQSAVGPTPGEALSLGLVMATTACLLLSSVTVHFAESALRAGRGGQFTALWGVSIVLGVLFLAGTGYEWYDLIVHQGLTISRNLFGTTFFTLVGFHAAHVTVGVFLLTLMLVLHVRGRLIGPHPLGVQLVSWYWHFVDGVWVVVFLVVYVVGR